MALTGVDRAKRIKPFRRAQPSLQNLRGLESFARTGSFAKAAIDQGLTVASISRRISALEKDLGLVLLERSDHHANKYELTEHGKALGEFLTPWLAALEEILPAELQGSADGLRQGRGRPRNEDPVDPELMD